ncbi:histidine kinase [Saccharomonospora sp. CUA-673]|uniref:sensor histidine kinase n=1 Tax=Saccharomonospora sp. CUA-673 TaxID=1904969 RepID=UPI0009592EE9|nr:sensor histidine kinase [Saccharomonospora sp. CUA-673]OLT45228.1 histidine kinase [Saccharomonospora sp. CUA-673]
MSLFARIFLLNTVVLCAATALLLFAPITVSTPVLSNEILVLVLGLIAVLVADAAVLRLGVAPLKRLRRTMTSVDLLRRKPRPVVEGPRDVAELITTFNDMLDRLEAARDFSAARALSVQEAERRRVAQELHDEVGQSLTAVLLGLKRVADQVPEPVRAELTAVSETTRTTLDEIRRIARSLRPGVLEELGLTSALKELVSEFDDHSDVTVRGRFDPDLPPLPDNVELVVYRVAQEAVTNAVRHSRAGEVTVSLAPTPDGIELRVRDAGRGMGRAEEGAGMTGMRERALLVGAALTVHSAGGTEVRLHVPLPAPDAATSDTAPDTASAGEAAR